VYKFDLNQQLDKGRQVISVQNQKKSIFNNSMQIDQIEVQDEEDDDEQQQQQQHQSSHHIDDTVSTGQQRPRKRSRR
jgi:hypothetical protein